MNTSELPHWPDLASESQLLMVFNGSPFAGNIPNPEQLAVLNEYFTLRRSPGGQAFLQRGAD